MTARVVGEFGTVGVEICSAALWFACVVDARERRGKSGVIYGGGKVPEAETGLGKGQFAGW